VFGTNANNLIEIIATLKAEQQGQNLGDLFIINPLAQERLLLVPVYRTANNLVAENEKYPIRREDLDLTARFYELLGDKIALVKYNCEPKVLERTKETFKQRDKYYDFNAPINFSIQSLSSVGYLSTFM